MVRDFSKDSPKQKLFQVFGKCYATFATVNSRPLKMNTPNYPGAFHWMITKECWHVGCCCWLLSWFTWFPVSVSFYHWPQNFPWQTSGSWGFFDSNVYILIYEICPRCPHYLRIAPATKGQMYEGFVIFCNGLSLQSMLWGGSAKRLLRLSSICALHGFANTAVRQTKTGCQCSSPEQWLPKRNNFCTAVS